MSWDIAKSPFPFAERCVAARPELIPLAKSIAKCCDIHNPIAWKYMSNESRIARRDNYFFSMVVPIAELSGWPSSKTSNLSTCLAAQLLWCFAWRTLDDVLDSLTKPSADSVSDCFVRFSDALALTLQVMPTISPRVIAKLTQMHVTACDAAIIEHSDGLQIEQAWKRSSQFFIVPSKVLNFTNHQMLQYRHYINALALAHDIHDFLSDIHQGIATPPTRWMMDIDPDFPFSCKNLRLWFRRASTELDKQITLARRLIGSNLRVSSIILDDLDEVARDLKSSC